jgi:hypothetical protein
MCFKQQNSINPQASYPCKETITIFHVSNMNVDLVPD